MNAKGIRWTIANWISGGALQRAELARDGWRLMWDYSNAQLHKAEVAITQIAALPLDRRSNGVARKAINIARRSGVGGLE